MTGMGGPRQWRFYLLACSDGTLYAGITNDLERRLATHNRGQGSRYTRVRLPVTLIFSETHADRSAAGRREAQVRRMSRAEKLALALPGRRRT